MEVEVEFRGNKKERELAQTIFRLMLQQGAMYALDRPIRQSLHNLTEYFVEQGLHKDPDKVTTLIETAVEKNDHIFARDEREERVFYSTSKRGVPPPEAEANRPRLMERQLHEPPDGATSKPRRRAVRRPPMAPFWVRASIRQRHVRPKVAEPIAPPVPFSPKIEQVGVAAVTPEEEAAAPVTLLTLKDGTTIDFAKQVPSLFAEYGPQVAPRLREALARDFRLESFGDTWYLEEQLERFSKGRLTEIRRYILEEELPLTDETILGDLFFKNPRDADYILWAFSLNARLLREKKDFEYVGVPGCNRWSVKGLPSIGTRLLKASDIGQDYDYLLQEEDWAEEPPVQLEHFLTYYEYRHGLLPYNAIARAFFPPAMLEDQRSAQLRFEMPQHYEAYSVELRYPSGNRGGWLWGLEDFFHSSLVPGAFIIISPSEEPDTFVLQYMVTDAQERRLVVYDERKDRYLFDEVLFYCEVEEGLLLSEERFGSLRNTKPIPPSQRKRPADVVAHAFSLIGQEQEDGTYLASLDKLFPVANIERPFSMDFLKETLAEVDVFEAEEEGKEGAEFYRYTPDKEE